MMMMMMTIESLCPARHRPYRILMEQANTILYCSECRVGVGHTAAFASARVAGAVRVCAPASRPGQRRWPTHRALVSWRGRGGAPAEHISQ